MGGFCEKTLGAVPVLEKASSNRLQDEPVTGQNSLSAVVVVTL